MRSRVPPTTAPIITPVLLLSSSSSTFPICRNEKFTNTGMLLQAVKDDPILILNNS